MSNRIRIPGFVYSLALAVLAWGLEYLTQNGGGIPWAPIAIGLIPMLIKAIEVQVAPKPEPTNPPSAQARGFGDVVTPAQPSKVQRFLLG